jgi:cytoskeletal protein CcmA (bactofilin family)
MGTNGQSGNGASTRRGNVVDEGSTFKGIITSNSTVTVRGVLEGEVEGPALEVESGGVLIGKAKVTELRSRGELAGQFEASDVELSGRVRDDTIIRAGALLVTATAGLGGDGAEPMAVFGGCQLEVGEVPSKEEVIRRVLSAGKPDGSVQIGLVAPPPPPTVSEPDGAGANKRKRPHNERPTEGNV